MLLLLLLLLLLPALRRATAKLEVRLKRVAENDGLCGVGRVPLLLPLLLLLTTAAQTVHGFGGFD